MSKLMQKILDRIEAIGPKAFAEQYDVSIGTVTNWKKNGQSKQLDVLEQILDETEAPLKEESQPQTLTLNGENCKFVTIRATGSWQKWRNLLQFFRQKGALLGCQIHDIQAATKTFNEVLRDYRSYNLALVFVRKLGARPEIEEQTKETESQCQPEKQTVAEDSDLNERSSTKQSD